MDKWLKNKHVIRVIALLVGILLWFIIRFDVPSPAQPFGVTTYSEKYLDVKVQVKNVNERQFLLRSIQPEKISLTVTGSQTALGRVSIRDYQVIADASKGVAGQQRLQLQTKGFPADVNVALEPSTVQVFLDEKQRKEMPVTLEVQGEAKSGYTVGEAIVQPNRVNVVVTASSVEDVAGVFGTVFLNEATKTVNQQVRLIAKDRNNKPLDLDISPEVVDVEIPITSPFQTVPLQVILEGQTPPGVAISKFEQQPKEVTVYGESNYVEDLEYYNGPILSLRDLTDSQTINLEIPIRSQVKRISPVTVLLDIVLEKAAQLEVKSVPLMIVGQNPLYTYERIKPKKETTTARVEVASSHKSNTLRDKIRAVVDVTDVPPGKYELPIVWKLPPFVEEGNGNEKTLTIKISSKKQNNP